MSGEWAITWIDPGVGAFGKMRSYSMSTAPGILAPSCMPVSLNTHWSASFTTMSACTGLHSYIAPSSSLSGLDTGAARQLTVTSALFTPNSGSSSAFL